MVSSLVALEDSLRLQAQRTLKGKPRAEYLPVNRDALDVEPFGEFPIE